MFPRSRRPLRLRCDDAAAHDWNRSLSRQDERMQHASLSDFVVLGVCASTVLAAGLVPLIIWAMGAME